MSTTKTKASTRQYTDAPWFGDDPTRCLADGHVFDFLELITGYWDSYWGLQVPPAPPRFDIPNVDATAPLTHMSPEDRAKRAEARSVSVQARRKRAAVASSLNVSMRRIRSTTEIPDFGGETMLHLYMLKTAIIDYGRGISSPFPEDQRVALNAYWWVFGHPWLIPPGCTAEDFSSEKFKLSDDDDPFQTLKIRAHKLVVIREDHDPPEFSNVTGNVRVIHGLPIDDLLLGLGIRPRAFKEHFHLICSAGSRGLEDLRTTEPEDE